MKTNYYILFICLISVLSMQSCVDSIPIPLQEVDAKLVLESDINAANGFVARISTSTGLSDVTATSFPTDLDVDISYGFENGFDLIYDEDCICYVNDAKPIPGESYNISARSPNNDLYEDITSRMTFPITTKSQELLATRNIEMDGSTSLSAQITLDGDNRSSNYYHIYPYRKVTRIEIIDEEEHEIYTGEIEPLQFIGSISTGINIESHFDKGGFLVDFYDEDVSTNTLDIELYTPTVLDYENEAFTKIFFEIRSVTESYYKYEKYQSRKYKGLTSGNGLEAISYSNITNGLGYFGGYSTTTDSISVN